MLDAALGPEARAASTRDYQDRGIFNSRKRRFPRLSTATIRPPPLDLSGLK